MRQEDDDDKADNDRLFQQVALQRGDRVVDQSGAVIACNDLYPGWKRRRNLTQLLLDTLNDAQGIHALAHHDDAADCLSLPIPLRNALPNIWTKGNTAQIA